MGLVKDFAIQLYSVRTETEKDFAGTVRKIAALGYTGVEFAGYGDLTANEMKALLDETGLKSVGSHVSIENLTENLEKEIAYNKVLGTKYIICPYASFTNREETKAMAEKFIPIAKRLKEEGFIFAYHNHSNEFVKDGNDYVLNILCEYMDPSLLTLELDLFWTANADVNVKEFLDKYHDRIGLLHIKQIENAETKRCVDLNKGMLDFGVIIKQAQSYGINVYVLEQEEFEFDAWTSLKSNIDYINSL